MSVVAKLTHHIVTKVELNVRRVVPMAECCTRVAVSAFGVIEFMIGCRERSCTCQHLRSMELAINGVNTAAQVSTCATKRDEHHMRALDHACASQDCMATPVSLSHRTSGMNRDWHLCHIFSSKLTTPPFSGKMNTTHSSG
jgi:hypothetical protein